MSKLYALLNALDGEVLSRPGATLCVGPRYPLLFFSFLLKKKDGFQALDDSMSFDEFIMRLSSSFLGNNKIFFLKKDLSGLPARERDRWLKFCTSYIGPHTLICFCSNDDFSLLKNVTVRSVIVPETITKDDYLILFSFLFPQVKCTNEFVKLLYSGVKALQLDVACVLAHYHATLGTCTEQFFDDWSKVIFGHQASLFSLSQFFFAKNPKQFFNIWCTYQDEYPLEFWITYWSEQLWQAFIYLDFAKKKNMNEGRKHAFRLPFMFLRNDWRKIHQSELVAAHQFLYSVDYLRKNGLYKQGLEIFYFKFFTGRFINENVQKRLPIDFSWERRGNFN